MTAQSAASRPRLLLVDDDPDNLEALSLLLAERYSVSSYGSAAEALSGIAEAKPDLLVLDIRMPEMGGLECLVRIREIPGYHRVPALAITVVARQDDHRRFIAGGFQAVVAKPIHDIDALMAQIAALLEASSLDPEQASLTCCRDANGGEPQAGVG